MESIITRAAKALTATFEVRTIGRVFHFALQYALLLSAVFSRQSAHALFLAAVGAFPETIRLRGHVVSSALPRVRVMIVLLVWSVLNITVNTIMAIILAASSSVRSTFEEYSWAFGMVSVRSPYDTKRFVMIVLINLGFAVSSAVYVFLRRKRKSVPVKDTQHHESGRVLRFALYHGGAALAVPSYAFLPVYLFHAAIIFSFLLAGRKRLRWKLQNVIAVVSSAYAWFLLSILLAFQNEAMKRFDYTDEGIGIFTQSSWLAVEDAQLYSLRFVQIFSLCTAAISGQRIHGDWTFLTESTITQLRRKFVSSSSSSSSHHQSSSSSGGVGSHHRDGDGSVRASNPKKRFSRKTYPRLWNFYRWVCHTVPIILLICFACVLLIIPNLVSVIFLVGLFFGSVKNLDWFASRLPVIVICSYVVLMFTYGCAVSRSSTMTRIVFMSGYSYDQSTLILSVQTFVCMLGTAARLMYKRNPSMDAYITPRDKRRTLKRAIEKLFYVLPQLEKDFNRFIEAGYSPIVRNQEDLDSLVRHVTALEPSEVDLQRMWEFFMAGKRSTAGSGLSASSANFLKPSSNGGFIGSQGGKIQSSSPRNFLGKFNNKRSSLGGRDDTMSIGGEERSINAFFTGLRRGSERSTASSVVFAQSAEEGKDAMSTNYQKFESPPAASNKNRAVSFRRREAGNGCDDVELQDMRGLADEDDDEEPHTPGEATDGGPPRYRSRSYDPSVYAQLQQQQEYPPSSHRTRRGGSIAYVLAPKGGSSGRRRGLTVTVGSSSSSSTFHRHQSQQQLTKENIMVLLEVGGGGSSSTREGSSNDDDDPKGLGRRTSSQISFLDEDTDVEEDVDELEDDSSEDEHSMMFTEVQRGQVVASAIAAGEGDVSIVVEPGELAEGKEGVVRAPYVRGAPALSSGGEPLLRRDEEVQTTRTLSVCPANSSTTSLAPTHQGDLDVREEDKGRNAEEAVVQKKSTGKGNSTVVNIPDVSSGEGINFADYIVMTYMVRLHRKETSGIFPSFMQLLSMLFARNTTAMAILAMFLAATYHPEFAVVQMVFIVVLLVFMCLPEAAGKFWPATVAYTMMYFTMQYCYILYDRNIEAISLSHSMRLIGFRNSAPLDLWVVFALLACAVTELRLFSKTFFPFGRVLKDIEWRRISNSFFIKSVELQLSITVTSLCFLLMAVFEPRSGLVIGFVSLFLAVCFLGTYSVRVGTVMWTLTTGYSVIGLLCVSLYQFEDIHKWFNDVVGDSASCQDSTLTVEKCTEQLGLRHAQTSGVSLTRILIPWFVACASNVVQFRLRVLFQQGLGFSSRSRKGGHEDEEFFNLQDRVTSRPIRLALSTTRRFLFMYEDALVYLGRHAHKFVWSALWGACINGLSVFNLSYLLCFLIDRRGVLPIAISLFNMVILYGYSLYFIPSFTFDGRLEAEVYFGFVKNSEMSEVGSFLGPLFVFFFAVLYERTKPDYETRERARKQYEVDAALQLDELAKDDRCVNYCKYDLRVDLDPQDDEVVRKEGTPHEIATANEQQYPSPQPPGIVVANREEEAQRGSLHEAQVRQITAELLTKEEKEGEEQKELQLHPQHIPTHRHSSLGEGSATSWVPSVPSSSESGDGRHQHHASPHEDRHTIPTVSAAIVAFMLYLRDCAFIDLGYEILMGIFLVGVATTVERVTSLILFISMCLLWGLSRRRVSLSTTILGTAIILQGCINVLAYLTQLGLPPGTVSESSPWRFQQGSAKCSTRWEIYLGCALPVYDQTIFFVLLCWLRMMRAAIGAIKHRIIVIDGCTTLGRYLTVHQKEVDECRELLRTDIERVIPVPHRDIIRSPQSIGEILCAILVLTYPTATLSFLHGAIVTSVVGVTEMFLSLCLIAYRREVTWKLHKYWPPVVWFFFFTLFTQVIAHLPGVIEWVAEHHRVAFALGVSPWSSSYVSTFSIVLHMTVIYVSILQDRIFNEFFFASELITMYRGSIISRKRHVETMSYLENESREQQEYARTQEENLKQKLESLRRERDLKRTGGGGGTSPFANDLEAPLMATAHSSTSVIPATAPPLSSSTVLQKEDTGDSTLLHHPMEKSSVGGTPSDSGDNYVAMDGALPEVIIGRQPKTDELQGKPTGDVFVEEKEEEAARQREDDELPPPNESKLQMVKRLIRVNYSKVLAASIVVISKETYSGRVPAKAHERTNEYRLLLAIGQFLIRKSCYLCFLLFTLNFALSGTLMDMLLCVSGFAYGMINNPWPKEQYWNAALIFNVVSILLKSSCKVIVERTTISSASSNVISVIFLDLGVTENRSVSEAAFNDILWDFFVFAALMLHKQLCVDNGVYATTDSIQRQQERKKQLEVEKEAAAAAAEDSGIEGCSDEDSLLRFQYSDEDGSPLSDDEEHRMESSSRQFFVVEVGEEEEDELLGTDTGSRKGEEEEGTSSVNRFLRQFSQSYHGSGSDALQGGEGIETAQQQGPKKKKFRRKRSDATTHYGEHSSDGGKGKRRVRSSSKRHKRETLGELAKQAVINTKAEVKFYAENIKDRHGIGKDYYAVSLLVEAIAMLVFVSAYYSLAGRTAGSFVQSVRQDLLPGPLVALMIFQVFIMVADRVVYNISRITVKFGLHLVLTVLYHAIFLYWRYGVASRATASGILLFFIKMVALFISCQQIRSGFPIHKRHDPFTKHPNIIAWLGYTIYRLVPFLFELRLLLDWSFTRTSLKVQAWMLLEDIHFEVYARYVDIDDIAWTNPKRGTKFPWLVKVYQGFLGFTVIMFILFFPLMYYSTFNPNLEPNSINSAEVSMSFGAISGFYSSSAIETPRYGEVGRMAGPLDDTRPTLQHAEFTRDSRTLQLMDFTSCSTNLWTITPATKLFLMGLLDNAVQNKSAFHIDITFDVSRVGASTSRDGDSSSGRKVTVKRHYQLPYASTVMVLQAVKASNTSSGDIPLPNFFSPFILNLPTQVRFFDSYLQEREKLEYGDPSLNEFDCSLRLVNSNEEDTGSNVRYWCVACDALFQQGNFPFRPPTPIENGGGSGGGDEVEYIPGDYELYPPPNMTQTSLFLVAASDAVPLDSTFLPNVGIVALYTTFILTLGSILRGTVTGSAHRVVMKQLADPGPIAELLSYIYLARSASSINIENLDLEEQLYLELLDMLRAPDRVLAVTGLRADDYATKDGKLLGKYSTLDVKLR